MEAAEAQQEFLGGAGEISGRGVERGSPGRGRGSYRYKKKSFPNERKLFPFLVHLPLRSRISRRICMVSEILQFKNGHEANEPHQENEEMVASQEKSEPIMVDRNQYSMDGELEGGFSFNARNEDARPGVRDEGVEFRYVAPRKFHANVFSFPFFFFSPPTVLRYFFFFFFNNATTPVIISSIVSLLLFFFFFEDQSVAYYS